MFNLPLMGQRSLDQGPTQQVSNIRRNQNGRKKLKWKKATRIVSSKCFDFLPFWLYYLPRYMVRQDVFINRKLNRRYLELYHALHTLSSRAMDESFSLNEQEETREAAGQLNFIWQFFLCSVQSEVQVPEAQILVFCTQVNLSKRVHLSSIFSLLQLQDTLVITI